MFRAGLTLLQRVILAACLLVLLICGVEVGVRVYEAVTGETICQSAGEICSDPSKLAIPSSTFQHELKPLSLAKVQCRDSKNEIEFRTNSFGLRSREPAIPKPANVCRIVVLGDETIYAPETSDSDHFCTLLQNQLQQFTRLRIEVINAGIPGHCPLTEFLLFKHDLIKLQPDLVLMHFDWSDVAKDRQIRRYTLRDDDDIPLSCPNKKLDTAKKVQTLDVWRQHFRLLDWGLSSLSVKWKQQLARQKATSRDVDTNAYAWLREDRPEKNDAFKKALDPIVNLAELCRNLHIQLVVMTSPKPWQVSATCSRGEGVRLAAGVARDAYFGNRAPFNVLANFTTSQNIPFVDGSTVMASGKNADANFLRHAPRWSPAGHRQMAQLVASFLAERVPGAWNSPYFQQGEQPVSDIESHDNPIQWTGGQKQNSPSHSTVERSLMVLLLQFLD